MPGFGRVEPPADVGVARWLVTTEGVSKQMATISIERNTAVKSIVVRFCANAFIKNRQNRKLRMWFCVFTHPRPGRVSGCVRHRLYPTLCGRSSPAASKRSNCDLSQKQDGGGALQKNQIVAPHDVGPLTRACTAHYGYLCTCHSSPAPIKIIKPATTTAAASTQVTLQPRYTLDRGAPMA